jgi:hypothetical protein
LKKESKKFCLFGYAPAHPASRQVATALEQKFLLLFFKKEDLTSYRKFSLGKLHLAVTHVRPLTS